MPLWFECLADDRRNYSRGVIARWGEGHRGPPGNGGLKGGRGGGRGGRVDSE